MGLIVLLLLVTASQDPEELVLLSLSAARAGDGAEVRTLLAAGPTSTAPTPTGVPR